MDYYKNIEPPAGFRTWHHFNTALDREGQMNTPNIGDRIQNTIGHWFEVVAVHSPYQFTVQALTPDHHGDLVPIGITIRAGRSEFRL